MAFYDSVKDDVRKENGESSGDEPGDGKVAFDELKKDADEEEEAVEQQESKGTEIEVLGEGSVEPEQPGEPVETAESPEPVQSEEDGSEVEIQADTPEDAKPEASAGVEGETAEILRRIEQQNDEMLNVLRGIKRSLE